MRAPQTKSPTASALAAKLAQELLLQIIAAVRKNRANRYALVKPWTLPRIREGVPDFEDHLFLIRDSVITVQPYDGDVSDGCTLAPDTIGPWKPVIGAMLHDPWYQSMERMAIAWDMPVGQVRRLGDRIFYGILIIVCPSWIARAYYRVVRCLGGVAHFVMRAAAVAAIAAVCCAGCSGCAAPESPFEDPGSFVLPEYEQTAGGDAE